MVIQLSNYNNVFSNKNLFNDEWDDKIFIIKYYMKFVDVALIIHNNINIIFFQYNSYY